MVNIVSCMFLCDISNTKEKTVGRSVVPQMRNGRFFCICMFFHSKVMNRSQWEPITAIDGEEDCDKEGADTAGGWKTQQGLRRMRYVVRRDTGVTEAVEEEAMDRTS